jgi:hypothetical protein
MTFIYTKITIAIITVFFVNSWLTSSFSKYSYDHKIDPKKSHVHCILKNRLIFCCILLC